jgi:DNA-binding transcriptional ArsR family regulator
MVGLPMNSNIHSVPTNKVLALVSDQTRRRLIRHLIASNDETVEVNDLIRDLRRDQSNSTHTSHSTSTHLRIELQHVHLPKLDEAGVVDYDSRSTTVRYNSIDNVEKLVTFITEELE